MTQDEIIPLNIEDEYVRNYLWERALIAIDDPCTKSHPHENMNEYCQHKTKDEPVALVAEVHISRYTIEWTNGPLPQGTKLYTTPQRKPLTDEQIWDAYIAYVKAPVDIDCHVSDLHKFARAIESAHGIKE